MNNYRWVFFGETILCLNVWLYLWLSIWLENVIKKKQMTRTMTLVQNISFVFGFILLLPFWYFIKSTIFNSFILFSFFAIFFFWLLHFYFLLHNIRCSWKILGRSKLAHSFSFYTKRFISFKKTIFIFCLFKFFFSITVSFFVLNLFVCIYFNIFLNLKNLFIFYSFVITI